MGIIDISQEELASFHAAHFTPASVEHFSHHFLGPVEDGYEEELEDDDELGYYEDGVKRTLTDQQIAIFRHSEIETLLRQRRHIEEAKENDEIYRNESPTFAVEPGEVEDGEIADDSLTTDTPTPPSAKNCQTSKKKSRKAKKKAQYAQKQVNKGFFKQNVKPDLRKRTWDKVEEGVGNLDYDDMESRKASAPSQASQRKKICYDDD